LKRFVNCVFDDVKETELVTGLAQFHRYGLAVS
jgi:hypothetical protein